MSMNPFANPLRNVVANIDVGATLLETAGLSTPKQMDGHSFWQLAKGNDIPWRDYVLYEYFLERNNPHTPTTHAVRGERFEYISDHGLWDKDELYDLLNDPDETTNPIFEPEHKQTVAMLNKRLFALLAESGVRVCAWLRTVGQPFPSGIRSAPRRRVFQNNFTATGNNLTYLTTRSLTHGQEVLTMPSRFLTCQRN